MAIDRITLGGATEFLSVDDSVDFQGVGVETFKTAFLTRQSDNSWFRRNGDNNKWSKYLTEDDVKTGISILGEPNGIDLSNGPAVIPIYTVPDNMQAYITNLMLVGIEEMTGTTQTLTLKVGTAANSYNELMNGSTGHTFDIATPSSLLPIDDMVTSREIYPAPTMNGGAKGKFNAGDVIAVDLTGTAFDGGKFFLAPLGFETKTD